MKRILLATLCALSFVFTYSQTNHLAPTLLWKISGKGLTRPSYLYGTMHLTDKRIFQLSDSLYAAIEKSDGFAAELDMDRLGMQLVNYVMADKEAKDAQ